MDLLGMPTNTHGGRQPGFLQGQGKLASAGELAKEHNPHALKKVGTHNGFMKLTRIATS